MRKINKEEGSITLYVLITMMLILSVVIIIYIQVSEKNSNQLKELEKIQKEYAEKSIEEVYKEAEKNYKAEVNIEIYTNEGNRYDLETWTNENLHLRIIYPYDVKEEDKYYYKNGEKIKYTENEIIEENCTIRVEYKNQSKEVKITKIDKTLPTVKLTPNGGEGSITEGEAKATISTKIEAEDNESGLKEIEYAWSQSNTEEPSNWTTFTNGQTITKTDCNAGKYYLWTKVTDIAGNRAETIKVSKEFNVTTSISGGTKKYIKKGGSVTLTPSKGGQAGNITWSTSDSSGAQLSSTSGNSVTVKGLTAGTYTVKATESVGGKSTSYTIEVTELKSGGNATVLEGNTVTLKPPIKSSNAGTITYKVTSGGSYATVNSTTGVVTGKEALAEKTTATITATESNGGATCTYTVTIKVWNGNGLLSDPYIIGNLRDIKKLSEKTNKTSTSSANYTYTSRYFKQTANINLGGSSAGNWTPIGKNATRFNGTYDGGSKTISGLYINHSSGDMGDRGLFGNTNTKATIKNLTISGANVTTISINSAICVGYNRGTIENVKISGGTLSVGSQSGGIAGYNDGGIITSCTNSATIKYTSTVSSSSWGRGWSIGGIVGSSTGTIQKCTNTGSITGTHGAGGIVGSGNVSIKLSVNKGNIISTEVVNGYTMIGGIIGFLAYEGTGTIENCYNTGKVQSAQNAGGIVGDSIGGGGKATIRNCYDRGSISGKVVNGVGSSGGIIAAINSNGTITMSNNYWLSTCGTSYGVGWNNKTLNSNNTGATPKTATELKSLAPTLGSAYKTDSKNINSGYPILTWQ